MQAIQPVLPYIQIGISIALIVAILLQQSAAGMGGAFGDNFSSTFHTRRGFEKTLFNATIILGSLFVLAAIVALISR